MEFGTCVDCGSFVDESGFCEICFEHEASIERGEWGE